MCSVVGATEDRQVNGLHNKPGAAGAVYGPDTGSGTLVRLCYLHGAGGGCVFVGSKLEPGQAHEDKRKGTQPALGSGQPKDHTNEGGDTQGTPQAPPAREPATRNTRRNEATTSQSERANNPDEDRPSAAHVFFFLCISERSYMDQNGHERSELGCWSE